MSPIELGTSIINDTFAHALPAALGSREARIQLLATGLQESKFITRQQVGGPAHGFWQNELGGMVKGVFGSQNKQVHALLVELCSAVNAPLNPYDAYVSMLNPPGDILACGIARLGLLMDPHPIPRAGDESGALQCYLTNWRPGRPRLSTWPENYQVACAVFPA